MFSLLIKELNFIVLFAYDTIKAQISFSISVLVLRCIDSSRIATSLISYFNKWLFHFRLIFFILPLAYKIAIYVICYFKISKTKDETSHMISNYTE